MINFNDWLIVLKELMVKTCIIKEETILDKESYKPYYDENITPYSVLRIEFGKDWVKAHQKWYYKTLKK